MSGMEIGIQAAGGVLRVNAPYHPDFPSRAKGLGGKWDSGTKSWTFDPRDEERVRALCRDIFGTDGDTAPEMVTLRVDVDKVVGRNDQECWVAGRCIARRPGRDWHVRLGEGVILLAGGFPSRGGSAKYPALEPEPGTVLEVRDVPRPAAEKAVAEQYGVKIVEPDAPADAKRQALLARREALLAELARVEAEIEGLG